LVKDLEMGKETAVLDGLARFGDSFIRSRSQELDNQQKQRQFDEEMAWKREQRQAERDRLQSDRQMRTSLADAVRPAQIDTGYQVTDSAGSDAFTKDRDAAAMMSDMSAAREQDPRMAGATRVEDTAYQDPRQAKAAQDEYNSQPAMLDRMATATMPNDPTKGMSLQNAANTARAGIADGKKKQQSELDERFNTEISNIAMSGPRWWEAAAQMYSESNIPALKGIKVEAVLSEDGKTVEFKGVMPDGKEKVVNSFEASEAGAMKWVQASAKADAKTKLGWLADRAKHLQKLDEERAKEGRPDKAPSGYQWAEDGALRPIPGGPADKKAGGGDDRAPSGYRFNSDGSLEPIPGGPASKAGGLNSMDRMLIDGRRKDSKREIDSLTEQLNDPMLTIQAKRDPEAKAKVDRLNARLSEAQAEYKQWDGAMSELATSALGRAAPSGFGAYRKESNLKNIASGDMGADPAAIERELNASRQGLAEVKDEGSRQMLKEHIGRLESKQKSLGLSSASQKTSGPITVASKQDYDALPSGTRYVAPDGTTRTKK
jgi:hypothetical protein